MIDLEKYNRLQTLVKKHQQKEDRAKGVLEELKKRLKKEFNCDSTKDAKALLESMEKEKEKLTKEYHKELQKFEELYGDKL